MKLLHTSDWHLGHRFQEQSQHEEQQQFLTWLEAFIRNSEVDILLVAGDIFDSGVPSAQSQKMYYDFLVRLTQSPCKHVVITGGNHDAPGTINAPKELLSALSVHVVGKVTENPEEEVFQLSAHDEQVIIAAVPYLRDQDIRRAVAGESFDQLGDRYKQALVSHYTEVGIYCHALKTANTPVIGMGHLFALGGSTSESEQSIYIGNLGDIGASDFPEIFDYIALGHLHRPQKVGRTTHIRYSGSPNILSFSEVGYDKNVVMIQTHGDDPLTIENIVVPKFREVLKVSGTVQECLLHLKNIDQIPHDLTPWVEVIIDNTENTKIEGQEINKAAEELNLQVLKISLKHQRNPEGLEALVEHSKKIHELEPMEVFKLKCQEQNFDLKNHEEIFDAFNEALQMARNH
jgi:exonuclease SbcD